jgi:hypothetical protein
MITNPFAPGDVYVGAGGLDPNATVSIQAKGVPLLGQDVPKLGPCAIRVAKNVSDYYCSSEDSLVEIGTVPPVFLPWTTPSYSDGGFMLAGTLISNMTGKSFSEMYHDTIFAPLNMSSSYILPPSSKEDLARSVVSEELLPEWASDTGSTVPSGGIYSSINDLSKLGVAILNNTLLSPVTTRKWMKPATFSTSLDFAVGRGWEIHRYTNPQTSKITDLYTKLGDSGHHGSVLVIIPQYDAGFTMAGVCGETHCPGQSRSNGMLAVLDHMTEIIVPALEAQARAEAIANYVGHYTSANNGVNASVTIAFNESDFAGLVPALTLAEWSFNGTDALAGLNPEGRPVLKPSILKQTPDDSPGQVVFQLSQYPEPPTYEATVQLPPQTGLLTNWTPAGIWTSFYVGNADFALNDQYRYAGVDKNVFVFDVDGQGRATAVSPMVQRMKLTRSERQSS